MKSCKNIVTEREITNLDSKLKLFEKRARSQALLSVYAPPTSTLKLPSLIKHEKVAEVEMYLQ